MIIVAENNSIFNNQVAELFCHAAKASVDTRHRFDVALCGGSTPRGFHQRLAHPPFNENIDWSKIHLFWVDDRCVPVHSPDSNYGNAKRDFIDAVAIPEDHVHPMAGWHSPDNAASAYHRELMAALDRSEAQVPVFDLVLLGIGTDGHVASLFPGNDDTPDTKWVAAVKGGQPDVFRLTLTYPVINNARHILFLVSGNSKAGIVDKIFNQPDLHLPAQKIKPVNGKVTWVMDRDAASLLDLECYQRGEYDRIK